MNIIFVSIPISLLLLGIGIGVFFWAVRSGQFDDLDSPAYSVLMDDEDKAKSRREVDTAAGDSENREDGCGR